MAHRLSSYVNGIEAEYLQPAVYARQVLSSGSERLVACAPDGKVEVLSRLVDCLEEPLLLLYVLHTPRGEGEPGRYQSPDLSMSEFRQFIVRFGEYLQSDGRFDIWVHSPDSRATVVWDRHNHIFAYGPLGEFEAALKVFGFSAGEPSALSPHIHHYRSEYDSDARAVLSTLNWRHSPLRPEDEQ